MTKRERFESISHNNELYNLIENAFASHTCTNIEIENS